MGKADRKAILQASRIRTAFSFEFQPRMLSSHAFSILSVIFAITGVAMIIGSTLSANPPGVIGENLVLVEVQVLPNFYMKPITFFTYCLFLSFAFGLNTDLSRRRMLQVQPPVLRAIYIAAWLVALGSGFEVMYHAVLWSAALAVQGLANPDLVVNPFPQSSSPINVVFASKIVVAIFFMSLFLIDYLRRIDRTRTTQMLMRSFGSEAAEMARAS